MSEGSVQSKCEFVVASNLRLVSKFTEKDLFFSLYERVAESRGWPDEYRTFLLQCVLAQEVCASFSKSDSKDYKVVKAAVLKAYELVPKAYRQHLRSFRKPLNCC